MDHRSAGLSPSWRGRAQVLGPLAFALAAVAFYFHAELSTIGGLGFPLDDSWIHLQFARSLAAGQGLAYNPGELSTGATSPLWAALLSLGFLLPGSPVLWAKVFGVLLHLVAVDATRRLALELGATRNLALLATGLMLATYWLVWSALSGMEIPLFLALSLWGTILHLRERRAPGRLPVALPLLALAALTRPEGWLLLALAVADRLLVVERGPDGPQLARPPWRALARGLALASLVLLPTLLFYRWVGGSFFPSTFAIKAGGALHLPDLRFLHTLLGVLFKPQPWMVLAAGAGVLRLVERLGGEDDRGLLPALWVLGLPLAFSLINPPGTVFLLGNFGRYVFPLFPFLIVLGVVGLAPAAALLATHVTGLGPLSGYTGSWRRTGPGLVAALALVVLAGPTVVDLFDNADFYATNVRNVEDGDVRLARLVASHLPPAALLAVEDVGAVKFLAPQRVLDLVGLVSSDVQRAIAATRSPADPTGERGLAAVLAEQKPDFLAKFTNFRPGLTKDPAEYRPLLAIDVPHNITLGGDRLVLYATPWCRFPLPALPSD